MSETTDLFDGQQAEPESDLSAWIGEDKKYKTQEDALKSVPHAQKHIQNLEESYAAMKAEMEKLQAEMQKREGMEEVLKRLEQRESQATEPQIQESQGAQPSVDPASLEELVASRVPELLNQYQTKQKQEQNLDYVQDQLLSRFGDKAKEALAGKAQELGISVQDLKEMSMKSPKAVLAYFGSTGNPTRQMQTSVNTDGMSQGVSEGTWKYYEQLRKSDPKTYWRGATQQKLFKDRARLGADFYK